jgi:DNA modification methylase
MYIKSKSPSPKITFKINTLKSSMITNHNIYYENSNLMSQIPAEKVNLIVTSPPYPMIEMWDALFSSHNQKISDFLTNNEGNKAYQLMHEELEKIWAQFDRILCDGGIVCINIGDATRKIGDSFKLYSNHSKITQFFEQRGYDVLPSIIWRKQTNKPNKFMGSGMYPGNAYVTLEHEYILIFRKGGNRKFSPIEVERRRKSAYFWEERNNWFSDIWLDLKGTKQKTNDEDIRHRSAAFPFELAFRLINMYSIQGDTVLDPFLGMGTTTLAAITSMRNSIGYEIDKNFQKSISSSIEHYENIANEYVNDRLTQHQEFVENRIAKGKEFGHVSKNYNFNIITNQEKDIYVPLVEKIERKIDNEFIVHYKDFDINKIRNSVPIKTKFIEFEKIKPQQTTLL